MTKQGRIVDETNEIIVINRLTTITNGRFTYVSLLPLSTK